MAERTRSVSWESYHLDPHLYKSERDRIIEDLEHEDDEDAELAAEELRNAPTLMETPWGQIIERDDSMNPFRELAFYMCHTNFGITAREFIIANFAEGVESVKVVSRYRLLVGFGKLFVESEDNPYKTVRTELANKLINSKDYPESLYRRQRKILTHDDND